MEDTGQPGQTRENLMDDLKRVVKDAEELLRTTSEQAGVGYEQARARFESTLSIAKENCSALEEQLMASGKEYAETADQYVRANPWQAVGIGAAAGLLIGLMLGRK